MIKEKRLFIFILLLIILSGITDLIKGDAFSQTTANDKQIEYLTKLCDNFSKAACHNPKLLRSQAELLLDKKFETNSKFKAYGNYSLAEASYYCQDYKDALKNYQSSLLGFILIKDSVRIATAYNSIGVVNYILGNDDKACEAYLGGFNYYNALHDQLGMGQMYHNIALIYWRTDNYVKGDFYALKGISIYKQAGEKKYLADMYNNYSVNLGHRFDYDKALFFFQQAMNIYDELGDVRGKSSVICNIGVIFEHKNNLDSASYYFKIAHQAFLLAKDTINLTSTYQKLAKINIFHKEYNLAIVNLKEAEKLNEKIGDIDLSRQLNADLSDAFEDIGDYKEALLRQRLSKQFSDTISKVETQAKIAEIESKFQVEQTMKEMEVLQQGSETQNFIFTFIIIIFILASIALYFYWKSFKVQEEKRALMLEHKVLRTQMNPHFIFNSLSAIQCYILDNKPEDALTFISDFAALLRLVLQYSKNEMIPIAKEKKILEFYISLQIKRFENKILYEVNIDKALLESNTMIPPMLAQPFIENSLVHAGLGQIKDAMILVNMTKEENFIRLTVEDNGIGIEASHKLDKDNKHTSMAISITRERLSLLNTNPKEKIQLNMTDLSHHGSRGTKVELMIPIS